MSSLPVVIPGHLLFISFLSATFYGMPLPFLFLAPNASPAKNASGERRLCFFVSFSTDSCHWWPQSADGPTLSLRHCYGLAPFTDWFCANGMLSPAISWAEFYFLLIRFSLSFSIFLRCPSVRFLLILTSWLVHPPPPPSSCYLII
jgi:hypothetical protein